MRITAKIVNWLVEKVSDKILPIIVKHVERYLKSKEQVIENYLRNTVKDLCYCNKCDHFVVKECEKGACICCLYDEAEKGN